MSRKANPTKAIEVTLSLSEQTCWYLDRLIERGLHGNNRAQVATSLVYNHCMVLVGQGHITGAPPVTAISERSLT